VWDFTHDTKNNNEFYYIKFDDELFKSFEKDYSKNRLLIPSKFCKTQFKNLILDMVEAISDRNLI
jgi:hypothetical protein